jgi:hypothetical protein
MDRVMFRNRVRVRVRVGVRVRVSVRILSLNLIRKDFYTTLSVVYTKLQNTTHGC